MTTSGHQIPSTTWPVAEALYESWQRVLRLFDPPVERTVTEWATAERIVAGPTLHPGPYDISKTPYWREPQDLVWSPGVHRILIIAGSQTGKTELELNVCGKCPRDNPMPIVVVLPKEGSAATWSTDRFEPMVSSSPALRPLFGSARRRKLNGRRQQDKILEKKFPGGSIAFVSASTVNDLAMRPAGLLIFDESKSYQRTREGSPKAIVRARTRAFPNAFELEVTSPHLKDSELFADWHRTDRREYFVPCPHCGEDQILVWRGKDRTGRIYGVVWDKVFDEATNTYTHLPSTARYRCRYCLQDWTDAQRRSAVDAGHWEATNPRGLWPGYRLPGLYSKLIRGLDVAAEDFLACGHDPDMLMAFSNTWLAEFWDQVAEGVEADPLFSRREPYTTDPVPAGVVFIDAGVDVQLDRIEYTIFGWGSGEECWILEHLILPGDTSVETNRVWLDLDLRLMKTYRHPKGATLAIEAAGIDSGNNTETVYRFCMPRLGRNIWATKGMRGMTRELVPAKPSKNNSLGCPFWVLGVSSAKDTLFKRLAMPTVAPPYIHFPVSLTQEYFDQLTAEEKVPTKGADGDTHIWRKKRPRNEALDCWCIGYGLLTIMNPDLDARVAVMQTDPLRFTRGLQRDRNADHQGFGPIEWLSDACRR